jgi:putative ABC transport system substrate-binding protein
LSRRCGLETKLQESEAIQSELNLAIWTRRFSNGRIFNMATVGIMHSGSQSTAQPYIDIITKHLQTATIDGPYYPKASPKVTLDDIANDLIKNKKVDLLIAAGGSRSADAAIQARGAANTPIIVFTSVAPYILNGLNRNITAGVCAHTSDHDVARLDWLLKLPFNGKRIGVLRNSNRKDHVKQKKDIDDAMSGRHCHPVHYDINSNLTLNDIFDYFKGDIHALLVAADSFFNNSRQQVVNSANALGYPAIYQWCEFVELGGLMSYGPSLSQCYDQAGAIAAQILDRTVNPPYPIWAPNDPNDFELCVSQAQAVALNMWPLPTAITNCPQYKPKP